LSGAGHSWARAAQQRHSQGPGQRVLLEREVVGEHEGGQQRVVAAHGREQQRRGQQTKAERCGRAAPDLAAWDRPFGPLQPVFGDVGDVVERHAGGIEQQAGKRRKARVHGVRLRVPAGGRKHAGAGDHVGSGREQGAGAHEAQERQQRSHGETRVALRWRRTPGPRRPQSRRKMSL
jgi:hypothetical protein